MNSRHPLAVAAVALVLSYAGMTVHAQAPAHQYHQHHEEDAHAAHRAAAAAGYERLVVGETAPGFVLTNQHGERVGLEDLQGHAVLMTFLYTHCTDVCPILVHLAEEVARSLPEAERARLTLVGVTVDPARDTPERLTAFQRERGLDAARWQLLTGSVADLTAVAADYGIVVRPAPRGDFVHNSVFFLIDAHGVEQVEYHGTHVPVDELVADLRAMLAEH